MTRTNAVRLGALVVVTLLSSFGLACGLFSSSSDRGTAEGYRALGLDRSALVFTDADTVRDLVVSGDKLYLATDRGVLVYPVGGGTPSRTARADGMPSDDATAIATDGEDGAWAAIGGELMHQVGGVWLAAPQAAPDVGRPTALVGEAGSKVWLGGTHGLARFDGSRWERFPEDLAITRLVRTGDGVWVLTANRGLMLVTNDGIVREHGPASGIPESYVRDVVAMRDGKIIALTQGPGGSVIGVFDGQRWFSYAAPVVEGALVAIADVRNTPTLVTSRGLYVLSTEGGSGQSLTPTAAAEPGGMRSWRVRWTEVAAPAPPPPPPAPPPPAAIDAGPPPRARRGRDAGPPPAADAPVAAMDAGTPPPPSPAAQPRTTRRIEPMRALRPPAPSIEVPSGGPTIEAPDVRVLASSAAVPSQIELARAVGPAVFLAERARGVTAIAADGQSRTYRTNDLAPTDRALMIATDGEGRTWLLTKDQATVRFDGRWFARAAIDDDPSVQPVALASRGENAVAVARVGDGGTYRVYRFDGQWRRAFERTVTAPVVAVTFAGLGDDGAVWLGIKVRREGGGDAYSRGAMVLHPQREQVVYHHQRATAETDGEGASQIPDDVTSVEMGTEGYVWFAGLSGASRMGQGQVVNMSEPHGVRGGIANDIVLGAQGRLYVATPQGIGYQQEGRFRFDLGRGAAEARVLALAVDNDGHLWGAGRRGAVYSDGRRWITLSPANGFPTANLVDVAVDGRDRVWFTADEGLVLFASGARD